MQKSFLQILLVVLCIHSVSAARIRRSVNFNGRNWANGCDFVDHDLSNARVPADQCGPRCGQTSGCTHFTWTTYNGGTCWMKSGAVFPEAVATSDASMVCGFVSVAQPSSSGGNYLNNCKFCG